MTRVITCPLLKEHDKSVGAPTCVVCLGRGVTTEQRWREYKKRDKFWPAESFATGACEHESKEKQNE
jgi:hypothetical protein